MIEDIEQPSGKQWIRLLVIVGIGIPILIEVVTFAGMVSHPAGSGTSGATATDAPTGAVEGDEILPSTESIERIDSAAVVARNDGWQFRLTVSVNNSAPSAQELRFGPVTTRAGRTVEGSVTTGTVRPGETQTVAGSWLLPKGQRPASIEVTVVDEETAHTVELGDVPVSN
jgi:hypothetical protein